ncbi:MAG: DNA methyltransferase [Armatimonadetes bacterium]|nr:DNA methyltransferase [Armatimonadota bacterium]
MAYSRPYGERKNRDKNKLDREDLAIHDWYRFVLSFPPHLVRDYLQQFHTGRDTLVLDPFCGTGTTLAECKKSGIPSAGIEAHPMAFFASSVKVDWSPNPNRLLQHAKEVEKAAVDQLAAQGIADAPHMILDRSQEKDIQSLPEESFHLLLTDSISPLPLHKALILRDALEDHRDDCYYNHERLAFAKALVQTIANLHFGPEVGVGPIKQDAPVIASWMEQIHRIVRDLKEMKPRPDVPAAVYLGDSRRISDFLPPASVSAVITSPPYPNEKDYSRTTRLESVLLGFIRDKADLQSVKRTLLRSNTRNIYKGDDDDTWSAGYPEITRLAEQIEARRVELGKTSGFERLYATVVKQYFGGMARHLAELRLTLRPGATLAYVVGDQASYLRVMIRTGQLLSDIAQSLGYQPLRIDLFRTRLSTATRQQLREEVVLLQWPG